MIPYINIHTHRKPAGPDEWVIRNAWLNPQNFTPQEPGYGLSVGIHPWHVHKYEPKEALTRLEKALENPKVWALGEIGLDRRKGPDLLLQKTWFEKQLELAEKHRRPVIIHCVRAYSDLPYFMKKFSVPLILHGYGGNPQQTSAFLKFPHVFFSFGPKSLADKPESARRIADIPMDRIFPETDTASVSIREVYERYSRITGIPEQQIKTALWNNFVSVTGHGS